MAHRRTSTWGGTMGRQTRARAHPHTHPHPHTIWHYGITQSDPSRQAVVEHRRMVHTDTPYSTKIPWGGTFVFLVGVHERGQGHWVERGWLQNQERGRQPLREARSGAARLGCCCAAWVLRGLEDAKQRMQGRSAWLTRKTANAGLDCTLAAPR